MFFGDSVHLQSRGAIYVEGCDLMFFGDSVHCQAVNALPCEGCDLMFFGDSVHSEIRRGKAGVGCDLMFFGDSVHFRRVQAGEQWVVIWCSLEIQYTGVGGRGNQGKLWFDVLWRFSTLPTGSKTGRLCCDLMFFGDSVHYGGGKLRRGVRCDLMFFGDSVHYWSCNFFSEKL